MEGLLVVIIVLNLLQLFVGLFAAAGLIAITSKLEEIIKIDSPPP